MTQIQYEPWRLFDQMDQIGRSIFSNYGMQSDRQLEKGKTWSPAVDIQELEDSYVIYADIPGIDPANIELSLEENVLTISGERTSAVEQAGLDYKRVERKSGRFTRRFTLPDSIDVETVSAKSDHGVLEVVIPKQEKIQPRRIAINA